MTTSTISTTSAASTASDAPVASTSQKSTPEECEASPTVHFAANVETISPEPTDISKLMSPSPTPATQNARPAVSPDQMRDLSSSLQGAHLQERRMGIFSFEPYSLPPSRVGPHSCFRVSFPLGTSSSLCFSFFRPKKWPLCLNSLRPTHRHARWDAGTARTLRSPPKGEEETTNPSPAQP